MSFSVHVRTGRRLGLADVLAAGGPGARTVDDDPPAGGWPDGDVHVVHLPGRSTRGVELSRDGRDLSVRLLTCSAAEEYALGVSLARAAAELSGTDVEAEDGWKGAPATVGDRYGAAWIADHLRSGTRIALTLADERGPITMSGPVRDFHLGARLAAELRAAGPEDELPERLTAAMRRAQWPGEEYFPASTMRLTGKASGTSVSFAVWPPIACVIPFVELVVLYGEDRDRTVPVARESVPAIAGPACAWLDERQLLLEAVPEARWPAVRAAAEPYRVELPA
jgi:hypothetical protein